jgi:hypothetical protein
MAAERSKIFQEEICPRMHVCFTGREGYSPDPIALSNKIEAHMGFSANVSSLVIRNLVDPYRRVQVVMAPLEDGSVPRPRVKYTSVFREIMNFVDDDNKPIFFALIPIKEGPDSGSSTLVLKDTEHAERVGVAFAKHPAAWIYHFLLTECGLREDCVLSILKSFTPEARGLVSETTWDRDNWTTSSPFSHIADTFVEDLEADGFVLTEKNLSSNGTENVTLSKLMAQEDLERLKAELQLRDDATCATRGDAASIISGATHTTLGNSSLRSVTEQDLNRDLEQACIANAKRMEAEAAARWGRTDALQADDNESAPPTSPTITPSTPPIPTHGGNPATSSLLVQVTCLWLK